MTPSAASMLRALPGPVATDKRTGEKFVKLAFDLDLLYEKQIAEELKDKPMAKLAEWVTLPCPHLGEPYSGFAVAGEDRIWRPATSVTRNGKQRVLEVRRVHVKDPVAVRYGWGNTPGGNAGNRGLPMLTFRTDDWPLPSSWPVDESEAEALAARKKARRERIEKELAKRRLTDAKMALAEAEEGYIKEVAGGDAANYRARQIADPTAGGMPNRDTRALDRAAGGGIHNGYRYGATHL